MTKIKVEFDDLLEHIKDDELLRTDPYNNRDSEIIKALKTLYVLNNGFGTLKSAVHEVDKWLNPI